VRERERYPFLMRRAIKAVCRTVDSDADAAREVLAPITAPDYLREHGHEDLHVLAGEVRRLADVLPDLVGTLYVNAFTYDEESEDVTAIGPSVILGLRSTRRQDYDTGLYVLGESFGSFLHTNPRAAIPGLDAAVRAESREWTTQEPQEHPFEFRGRTLTLRTDGSHYWDDRELSYGAQVAMLRAFDAYADELAAQPEATGRHELLEAIVGGAQSAGIWRRVLMIGARNPGSWGVALWELAAQPAILLSWDTTPAVSPFVAAVFPLLSDEQRRAIECALVALPETVEPEVRDRAVLIGRRIISATASGDLVTEEARRVHVGPAAVAGEPAVTVIEESYTDEDFLEDQGVDLAAEPNATLWRARAPLLQLVERMRQQTPSAEVLEEALAEMERAQALLAEPPDGASERLSEYEWGDLGSVLTAWTENARQASPEQMDRVVPLVVAACNHPLPRANSEANRSFDEHPSWSSADVRVSGAASAMNLARAGRVLPEISALAHDPAAVVRTQVLNRLAYLSGADRALMFELAGRGASEEESSVAAVALVNSLHQLIRMERDQVSRMVGELFDRFRPNTARNGVRHTAAGVLAVLSVWFADPAASERLDSLSAEPVTFVEELKPIVAALRNSVAYGDASGTEEAARVRLAGLRRLASITDAACRAMHEAAEAAGTPPPPRQSWSGDQIGAWSNSMALVAAVAQEVYFGSGAYDALKGEPADAELRDSKLARFATEGRPLLRSISTVGWPAVVHHLIDTLRALVAFDPAGILEIAAASIVAGQQMGYQQETLAMSQVVELVSDYLANHRDLLASDQTSLDRIVDILNGFAELGWEPAVRLVYRLDEVFR
jgi:hypothetical protein